MLQQVVLATGGPMYLDITDADPNEIITVTSITGLDPADVTLFMGDFSRDGGYYQGRRSSGRNPVITLKLNPDYANDVKVNEIREILYEMFLEPSATDDGMRVILIDDELPDRYFIGYTEKFLSDIFVKDTTAQISMMCPEPFLLSQDEVTASDATGWVTLPVEYEGSAKTGLEMEFKIKTNTSVVNIDINGVVMTLTGTFVVDDVITMNTKIGSRYIRLNGVDIMAALTSGPQWVQLRKGTNTIKSHGSVEGDGKVALMEYTYRAAWWGI